MSKKYNIYTSSLGLGRSVLALGNLTTLLFSSIYVLFPPYHLADLKRSVSGLERGNLFLLFNYNHIWIAYSIAVVILLIVISGIYPRVTCLLHAWVACSLYQSILIVEGGDQITEIISLLLIPICLFDPRKNHWSRLDNDHRPFIIRYFVYCALLFIQFQMAVLYLDAGVEKMRVDAWTEGTAVYYWFNHNVFGAPHWLRTGLAGGLSNSFFISSITWGVILLELFLFTAIFHKRRYKYVLFLFAIVFHFAIFLTHGLPSFGLSMYAGLIFYLWRMDFTVKENYLSIRRIFKPIKNFRLGRLKVLEERVFDNRDPEFNLKSLDENSKVS